MGLVDSILGGNQGDAYLEQLAKQRQARKQQAASNASALLDLSKLANDDASITNVENMANKMPGFGVTNSMYKSAIKESIKGLQIAETQLKMHEDTLKLISISRNILANQLREKLKKFEQA